MTSRRHLLLTGGGLVAALGLPKAALADTTKVAKPPTTNLPTKDQSS